MTGDILTREHFEGQLDQSFTVSASGSAPGAGEDSVEVELVRIKDVPDHNENSERAPFSLLFLGPSDAMIEQGTYRFAAKSSDSVFEAIFIVPIGPDEAGRIQYEAVFN